MAESRAGRGQGSSGAIRGAECVFYARGHCKFGNDCKFIHLESSRVSTGPNNRARGTTASPDNRTSNGSNEEDADALLMSELAAALPKTAVPCKFFAEGLCTRDNCRFSHATDGGKTVEDCPICLQRVVSPKMFGLLSGCDHPVCLDCIREWRKSDEMNENKRACPVCRVESTLVIPSAVFATGAAKNEMRASYLSRLSSIPCKHFNKGHGRCPYAPECNYAHLNADGTLAVDANGLQKSGKAPPARRLNHRAPRAPRSRTSGFTREEQRLYVSLTQIGLTDNEQNRAIFSTLSSMGWSTTLIASYMMQEVANDILGEELAEYIDPESLGLQSLVWDDDVGFYVEEDEEDDEEDDEDEASDSGESSDSSVEERRPPSHRPSAARRGPQAPFYLPRTPMGFDLVNSDIIEVLSAALNDTFTVVEAESLAQSIGTSSAPRPNK